MSAAYKAKPLKTRQNQRRDFGALRIEVYADSTGGVTALFVLDPVEGLLLRRYWEPVGYSNTLDPQYQWYHMRPFKRGEKLIWQSTPGGQDSMGPWKLYAENPDGEVCWDIPAIRMDVPNLALTHRVFSEGRFRLLSLRLENLGKTEVKNLCLQTEMDCNESEDKIAVAFSGPVQTYLDILPGGCEKLVYTLHAHGTFHARIYRDRLLQHKRIMVQKATQMHRENRNVMIKIFNARNKEILPKRGYYCVAPGQKLKVIINPRGQDNVSTVKNINIEHPNISVAPTGKSNDNEFSYDMEFHPSSPLTTKMIVMYSVEYQNSEVRSQNIACKLKAPVLGLLLLGFLFIAPNFIELFIGLWGIENSRTTYVLILLLCIMIPFIYDRMRSYF